MYKIYTLADPRTNEIRYVGLTCKTLASRRSSHLTDARNLSKKNHRTHWLRSLLKQQLKPVIELLDEASSYDDLIKLEIYWISQLKAWNFRLINETDGGEGSVGYKHTPESMLKILIANRKRQVKPKKSRMTKEDQYTLLSKALSIPILQYDLKGNFVKQWVSRLKAAKVNNSSSSAIGHSLKDPTRTAIRFYWRYQLTKNYPDKIQVSLKKGNKQRLQVECSTGEILLFDNGISAEKALNISYPTILKYLRNGKTYKDKYTFKKQENERIHRYMHK